MACSFLLFINCKLPNAAVMFACCIFFSGFCFDLIVVLMFVLLFLFLFSKFIRFREGCIAFPCNYKEVFLFFLFFKVNLKGMLKNLREFFWSVAIFKYKFDRDVISRNNGKLFPLRLCFFSHYILIFQNSFRIVTVRVPCYSDFAII